MGVATRALGVLAAVLFTLAGSAPAGSAPGASGAGASGAGAAPAARPESSLVVAAGGPDRESTEATTAPIINPLSGAVETQSYGSYYNNPALGINGYHSGVDLSSPGAAGTIKAPADGTVVRRCLDGDPYPCAYGYGNHVVLRHVLGSGTAVYAIYGHMAAAPRRLGTCVTRGTALGTEGRTGTVTARHLHWAVRNSDGPWTGYPSTHPNRHGFRDPMALVGATARTTCGPPDAPPQFGNDTPRRQATVGVPYRYQFTASGRPEPEFELAVGALPSGLRLNRTTGVLAGTPTTADTYRFRIRAENRVNGAARSVVTGTLIITVNQAPGGEAPVFTDADPPGGAQGEAYSYQFGASGSPEPTFRKRTGSLPQGLTLSARGLLRGTPSAAGTFEFTIEASNEAGPAAVTPLLRVVISGGEAPLITAASPSAVGETTRPYRYRFEASGAPPPTFAHTGTLPPGLTLTGQGVLSGEPTISGTYTFRVQATSGGLSATTEAITVTVTDPIRIQLGTGADIAVAGDWDGDGIDTPAVYRPSSAMWYFTNSFAPGSLRPTLQFGIPGRTYVPIAGDWDDDGIDTPGLYEPVPGDLARWTLRNSFDESDLFRIRLSFGNSSFTPVAGDWDGNGTDTPGVFNRSEREWILIDTFDPDTDRTNVDFIAGSDVYLPVVGDWDGNGTDTPGLFRPSDGLWVLRNSTAIGDAAFVRFTFGNSAYTPVAGDWNRDGADTAGAFHVPNWVLINTAT